MGANFKSHRGQCKANKREDGPMKKQKENIFVELDKQEKERKIENVFDEKREKDINFFDQFDNLKGRNRSLAIY